MNIKVKLAIQRRRDYAKTAAAAAHFVAKQTERENNGYIPYSQSAVDTIIFSMLRYEIELAKERDWLKI